MLVICALALVVASAFFLVAGLAGGDVGDLYLSMVLCVGSLIVVVVSARVGRVRPAPATDEVEPEPAVEVEPAPVAQVEASANGSAPVPIAVYASLETAQITELLEGLDDADLVRVQAAERAGDARVGVLLAVADQIASRTEPRATVRL